MTTIPESTMREAQQIYADVDYVDTVPKAIQIIAAALHAARQDQIRKDAEIARRQAEVCKTRPCWKHGVTASENIATAIETQGGEK